MFEVGDKIKLNNDHPERFGLMQHLIYNEGLEMDRVYTVKQLVTAGDGREYFFMDSPNPYGYSQDGFFILVEKAHREMADATWYNKVGMDKGEPTIDYLDITKSLFNG